MGPAALVLAGVCVSVPLGEQEHPGLRKAAALEAAVAEVEAGRTTTPIIGEPASGQFTVTFLARRSGRQLPRIVSDVTGWGEQPDDTFSFAVGTMARVGATDWYVLETTVAPGARIEYLIAYAAGDYRIDPHNPRQARFRGSGPASELVTPGYVTPRALQDPPVSPAGRATEHIVESRVLAESRRVIVYTPPAYREGGSYPVAVFHDHFTWGHEGDGPRLLDWLVAHGVIEPIVAVFADSGRVDDEGRPGALRAFLADELPRWLASRYAVTSQANERAILGVSYGAKDALEAALLSPTGFGRVGLLIPGRRLKPADIEALAGQRARRVQVAILAGWYDAANLGTARRARQALAAAGHAVHYLEVAEGHNASTWRDHAGAILAALFPPL